jgi:TIR domain
MDEASWKRILNKIHDNTVVPILGARLLVGADGQSSLQKQVAERLLEKWGLERPQKPLVPFRELNEVVSMRKGPVVQDCYDDVCEEIQAASNVEIPSPIQQLSQIADFRFFVTLTPDDLLARSLRQRCSVNEIIHSPNLPTDEGKDLPLDWKAQNGEVQLLYLFGKLSSAPTFAIHDEDVLEYAHDLIAHGSPVPRYLGELQQRNLLLLGCNFPDWLSRFFLRATNQKRLLERDRRAWLIEPLEPQESLTCFLRSYSKETEILSEGSPVEFVAELYRRWMAAHGAAPERQHVADETPTRGAMFFISYSRQTDLGSAELMYQALLKQGVTEREVWFDRRTIEPAQDFQRRIMDGIDSCRYFLPLLSQAVNHREEGFVFKEWLEATEKNKRMNREFLLPIIVDPGFQPELYNPQAVWDWRQHNLQFGHAPNGVPDGALEAKLKKLVREARKAE